MAESPATALARLVNISTHTGSVLCCFAVQALYELLYTCSSVIHPSLPHSREVQLPYLLLSAALQRDRALAVVSHVGEDAAVAEGHARCGERRVDPLLATERAGGRVLRKRQGTRRRLRARAKTCEHRDSEMRTPARSQCHACLPASPWACQAQVAPCRPCEGPGPAPWRAATPAP